MSNAESNKQVVVQFLDVIQTYEPATYEPYLTASPTHRVNTTAYDGLDGWATTARLARLLYPQGHRRRTIQKLISEGDSVLAVMTVEATTNSGAEYENTYALVFTLKDGLIADLIEIFDSRAMDGKFDLSVLT
jgi:ketosteroid isomerase-like protein